MKKWIMNITAIGSVAVHADSYNEAIEKGLRKATNQITESGNPLHFDDFGVINKTVEIINDEEN